MKIPMPKMPPVPSMPKASYSSPPMRQVRRAKLKSKNPKIYRKYEQSNDLKLSKTMLTGVEGATSKKHLATKVRAKWGRIQSTKQKHNIKGN